MKTPKNKQESSILKDLVFDNQQESIDISNKILSTDKKNGKEDIELEALQHRFF